MCELNLPEPAKGYFDKPHKGGADLKQPTRAEWEKANTVKISSKELEQITKKNINEKPQILKLIRKIWEK